MTYKQTPDSFVNILKICEATGKRKPKIDALTTADESAVRLISEALNPYRVYGVKKFDDPLLYSRTDASADLFINLLDNLCTSLSGNAARDAVTEVLSSYTHETAQYLKRIIAKDLRTGFSADTLNKVHPDSVPVFSIMLAEKITDSYVFEFPCIADVKYDGTRLIAICVNGVVQYFGRGGKEAEFAYGIYDDDLRNIERVCGMPIVVDGEALASSFTETLNAKGKGNTDAKKNLKLYAFDLLTYDEWISKTCTRKQIDRTTYLRDTLQDAETTRIVMADSKICNDYDEVYTFFKDVITNNPKGQDEGLIIKKIDGFYEWDRSSNWTKKKPVYDFDLQIVGFYEGRNRNEGTLGGITVEGYDENGNFIRTNVGSGFSDKMRNEIWFNKPAFLGKTALIEAQELSQNASDLTKWSLRFPVFVRIRHDK